MKKVTLIILNLILLLPSSLVYGQEDRDLVTLANVLFKSGDFNDALGMYQKAIEKEPGNAEANFMAGRCYTETTCCKDQSIPSLLTAYRLDPTISNKIFFYLGDAYHKNNHFDSAIVYYQKYKEELEVNRRDFLGVDVDAEIKIAERRIYESNNCKEYTANPENIRIENIGGVINSEFEDYAPTISLDNDELYFTSRRAGTIGDMKHKDNKFFEDIWYSQQVNGEWIEPVNIGKPVNDEGHNSNLGLSPDGNRLFIYSAENAGDILYSDKKNGVWSSPKPLSDINTEFKETSISITPDGAMMFFTSSKTGGYGGTDIYYCELNADLECTQSPKNIGPEINTDLDEESPYYDVTNNILYFASKGHKGMGGFDLYESVYNEAENTWSEPRNLGSPVNTTENDVFMTLSADGKTGYYATNKKDSYGGSDIYIIYPMERDNNKDEELETDTADSTETQVVAKATGETYQVEIEIRAITDQGAPIEYAKIEIRDDATKAVYIKGEANDKGRLAYELSYKKSTKLMISAEGTGFYFHSKYSTIDTTQNKQKIVIEIKLKPIQEMVIRPLKNIYFGFDKHTLTPNSYIEIDKLYNMMIDQPKIHIEIVGHTDFIGDALYNVQLSEIRAKAVRTALIKKGISPKRIQSKGYGEKYPLATNDDEKEGRELNRRTEFIVIPH